MKEIKVVKENPCDDCGIKGLYDNCKDKCVQYRKYYQYQQGIADERPKAFGKGYDSGYQKGREDAERDFQNSDYWNDYLAKVIADARADAIEELKPNADMVAYEQGRLDEKSDTLEIVHRFFMEEMDTIETYIDEDDGVSEIYKDQKKAWYLLNANKRLCTRLKEQKK